MKPLRNIFFATIIFISMNGPSMPADANCDLIRGNVPGNGFVPDSATAISIAEAVLFPIYGKDVIIGERPFTATESDGKWTVEGTFHPDPPDAVMAGGVAVVVIDKRCGKILELGHGA